MRTERDILKQTLSRALFGKDAHVQSTRALEGLDWKNAGARPKGMPHSIFQLLNHMIYWQHWTIQWLDGKKPKLPKHASMSWPGDVGPKNQKTWQQTTKAFLTGQKELFQRCQKLDSFNKSGKWSCSDIMQIIGSHNSYHLGQIVLIRRMLDSWPPPSGGDTW